MYMICWGLRCCGYVWLWQSGEYWVRHNWWLPFLQQHWRVKVQITYKVGIISYFMLKTYGTWHPCDHPVFISILYSRRKHIVVGHVSDSMYHSVQQYWIWTSLSSIIFKLFLQYSKMLCLQIYIMCLCLLHTIFTHIKFTCQVLHLKIHCTNWAG
jgi:hypothetical protein